MIPTPSQPTSPSTETFNLPPECGHLIGKLRLMTPEQRATIIHTKEDQP